MAVPAGEIVQGPAELDATLRDEEPRVVGHRVRRLVRVEPEGLLNHVETLHFEDGAPGQLDLEAVQRIEFLPEGRGWPGPLKLRGWPRTAVDGAPDGRRPSTRALSREYHVAVLGNAVAHGLLGGPHIAVPAQAAVALRVALRRHRPLTVGPLVRPLVIHVDTTRSVHDEPEDEPVAGRVRVDVHVHRAVLGDIRIADDVRAAEGREKTATGVAGVPTESAFDHVPRLAGETSADTLVASERILAGVEVDADDVLLGALLHGRHVPCGQTRQGLAARQGRLKRGFEDGSVAQDLLEGRGHAVEGREGPKARGVHRGRACAPQLVPVLRHGLVAVPADGARLLRAADLHALVVARVLRVDQEEATAPVREHELLVGEPTAGLVLD